jgi:hypothetical protein
MLAVLCGNLSLCVHMPAEPCKQHLEAAAAARRAALLVYDAAEVMVELVSEQELPAAFTGTGGEHSRLATI